MKIILLSCYCLMTLSHVVYANDTSQPIRAVLLTPVSGKISPSSPQPVQFKIVNGEAKGCVASGTAHLNPQRLRYEYNLLPINCENDQGKLIRVGSVVRGQHNIKGTMANSGMGRDYLLSKRGLEVTLSEN